MAYRVVVPPTVEKQIAVLHPLLKKRIRSALDELADNPFKGKPLVEELAGFFSYRVDTWRIVYAIRRNVLEVQVVAVGPRKTIYQSIL